MAGAAVAGAAAGCASFPLGLRVEDQSENAGGGAAEVGLGWAEEPKGSDPRRSNPPDLGWVDAGWEGAIEPKISNPDDAGLGWVE